MRTVEVLAGMVMAAAAAVAASAAGGDAPPSRQIEARASPASEHRSDASPSAAEHAKAAIRRYGDGAVRWRRPFTKHKHRRSGERAHRRWRRRRATGRRWK